MRKILSALLAAALLLSLSTLPALAEMRRGDRGEDVEQLQQLLLESGWLFELPDGVFGRNTEAALKNYQAYAGLAQTGVADDETVARLTSDWAALLDIDLPDPSGEGEYEGDPPVHCIRSDEGEIVHVQMCGAEQELARQAEALLATGRDEDGEAACRLWLAAIAELYGRWTQAAAPAERLNIAAAHAAFLAQAEKERAALAALYPDEPQYVYAQTEARLRAQAMRLCGLLGLLE